MYSIKTKDEAIKLRKQGYSYEFISSYTSVAKSTLSVWLKDVPFEPGGLMLINRESNNIRLSNVKRADKARSIVNSKEFARETVGLISERDILMFGLGIYLGEGSKTANITRIVNSDPLVIKFSILWFKQCFGLTNSNFRIRIHLYPDNDQDKVIGFWMRELNMNKDVFQPCYVDVRLNKKSKRRGVLPNGTAHVTIVSNGNKDLGVLLQRKITASIDFVFNKSLRD